MRRSVVAITQQARWTVGDASTELCVCYVCASVPFL